MPAKTKKEVAERVGRSRDNWAFRGAWDDLERDGEIVQINGNWVAGVVVFP